MRKIEKNALISIIALLMLSIIFSFTYQPNYIKNTKSIIHHQSDSRVIKYQQAIQNKSFIYLYNVATCLPWDLLTNRSLGDGTERDILVLSYASRCLGNYPQHVEYIFTSNKTTWGEGRNILYW